MKSQIIGLEYHSGASLIANDKNWRVHDEAQTAAAEEVLDTVGFVSTVVARRLPDGSLQLLDGHLRASVSGNKEVPVLVIDADDEAADYILATHDALGMMASADSAKVRDLLKNIEPPQVLTQFLDKLEFLKIDLPRLKYTASEKQTMNLFAVLVVEKIKIPLTTAEHDQFLELLRDYTDEYQTMAGFFSTILPK
ncbi:hypothetical protein FACS189454_08630 [Planctomycetales bacterium]|nr:hypothetical protein FACS189454_08630 [Planctomycetales bacterium]